MLSTPGWVFRPAWSWGTPETTSFFRRKVHLLISEPEKGTPSTVMQVVKQRFAKSVLQARHRKAGSAQQLLWNEAESRHIWQARFYDFNVWSKKKRIEKLRYMYENPVKRGLVLEAGQWGWQLP